MTKDSKYYQQIKYLAVTDWDKFEQLVGERNIAAAIVCLMREDGKSMAQIAQKLSYSKGKVQAIDENRCNCE